MELSQTKLKERTRRKTNPEIIELLRLAGKNKTWMPLAKIISSSARKYSSVNLEQIDEKTEIGDTVVIPGKVLSAGNLTKKIKICALTISESARTKLKETKSEFSSITDEIKLNPKAAGIKLIR